MENSKIALGTALLNDLANAFGLSMECTRVVIDLEVGKVARIIRVDLLTTDQAKALVESLKRCNCEVV